MRRSTGLRDWSKGHVARASASSRRRARSSGTSPGGTSRQVEPCPPRRSSSFARMSVESIITMTSACRVAREAVVDRASTIPLAAGLCQRPMRREVIKSMTNVRELTSESHNDHTYEVEDGQSPSNRKSMSGRYCDRSNGSRPFTGESFRADSVLLFRLHMNGVLNTAGLDHRARAIRDVVDHGGRRAAHA